MVLLATSLLTHTYCWVLFDPRREGGCNKAALLDQILAGQITHLAQGSLWLTATLFLLRALLLLCDAESWLCMSCTQLRRE